MSINYHFLSPSMWFYPAASRYDVRWLADWSPSAQCCQGFKWLKSGLMSVIDWNLLFFCFVFHSKQRYKRRWKCNKTHKDAFFVVFFIFFAVAHTCSWWKEQLPAGAGGVEPEPDALGPMASRVEVRTTPRDFSPGGSLWKKSPAAESRREKDQIPPTWWTKSRANKERYWLESHQPPRWTDTQMKMKRGDGGSRMIPLF